MSCCSHMHVEAVSGATVADLEAAWLAFLDAH